MLLASNTYEAYIGGEAFSFFSTLLEEGIVLDVFRIATEQRSIWFHNLDDHGKILIVMVRESKLVGARKAMQLMQKKAKVKEDEG